MWQSQDFIDKGLNDAFQASTVCCVHAQVPMAEHRIVQAAAWYQVGSRASTQAKSTSLTVPAVVTR